MNRRFKRLGRRIIYFFRFEIKFYFLHILKFKAFVCCNSAVHGNMGDQALGECRRSILKEAGIKNWQIIELSKRDEIRYWEYLKKTIKVSDCLMLRGGGYFGSLWEDGFADILSYIETFNNNEIILFPQSVYFGNDSHSAELLKKSQQIIKNAKKLILFARDNNSYKLFTEYYPNSEIYYTPDTVLFCKICPKFLRKKNLVLLCLRNDKEKNISADLTIKISKYLESKNIRYEFTDTVINYNFKSLLLRKHKLKKMWREFGSAKLIITDRMHGMVFSCINSTKCIVFDNIDGKVRSQYEFVRSQNYIKIANDFDEFVSSFDELMTQNRPDYDVDAVRVKFNPLLKVIGRLK